MKLRLFACLLALLLLLSLVACQEEPEEPIGGTPPSKDTVEEEEDYQVFDSGYVEGTPLRWELRTDDTLYILGTGAMPEDMITKAQLGNNDQPWGRYANTSTNEEGVAFSRVVIEDTVTGISQMSFKNCERLTEVVLGKGITKIPYDCFTGSPKLQKVVAKGATVIEENAFQNCKALTSLTVSASLAEVQIGAFDGAGTDSNRLSLALAGTEAEWTAAKDALLVVDAEGKNKLFVDSTYSPIFVAK